MARDRVLPEPLARTNGRGVPWVAVVTVSAVALVVGIAFADHSSVMTSLVTFGALSSYVLLHAAVVARCWVTERSGRWLVHLVVPVAGALSVLAVLATGDALALTVGLVWLAVGVGGFLIHQALRRTS